MPTFSTQQTFDVARLRYQDDLEAAHRRRQIDRPGRSSVAGTVKLALTALLALF